MHIVYMVEFTDRVNNMEYPCYYIGSKGNGKVINNKIIDKFGKEYIGSSTSKLYKDIFHTENKNITILYESEVYQECLCKERDFHILYDVVADIRFFNKGVATVNNYTDPEYATYKHSMYPEYRRLPRDHALVLNGTWVGTTSGRIIPEAERKSRGLPGELNPFYGKTHTKESMDQARKSYQKWLENNPTHRTQLSELCKATFTGKPKSEQQKLKMSESGKGYITLKNRTTLEVIRIKKDSNEYKLLNLDDWGNPYALRDPKPDLTCDICGKVGKNSSIFYRWHFKNCKQGSINENTTNS